MNATRLTQTELARLLGRPTIWLRDNANLVPRRGDGKYDLAAVVKALSTTYEPADLPPRTGERALQAAEGLAWPCDSPLIALTVLEQLQRDHGPAGLAAFGELMLEVLAEVVAGSDTTEYNTAEAIALARQAECKRAIAADVLALERREARHAGRVVYACQRCQRFRLYREWRPLDALPADYVAEPVDHCPNCDK